MITAATIMYELVYMTVPEDGDLSSFVSIGPVVAGFVNGPFHSFAELTRFLELRALYVPHLVKAASCCFLARLF